MQETSRNLAARLAGFKTFPREIRETMTRERCFA